MFSHGCFRNMEVRTGVPITRCSSLPFCLWHGEIGSQLVAQNSHLRLIRYRFQVDGIFVHIYRKVTGEQASQKMKSRCFIQKVFNPLFVQILFFAEISVGHDGCRLKIFL